MGPRKGRGLEKFGIASFAIAVRIRRKDGEGKALAAILFSSLATKDVALRRKYSNNVVLARAVLMVNQFCIVNWLFFSLISFASRVIMNIVFLSISHTCKNFPSGRIHFVRNFRLFVRNKNDAKTV